MKSDNFIEYARDYLVSKKLDAFEIYCLENAHFLADAKHGNIESLENAKEIGVAFRIINDHRLGFSYTTSCDEDNLRKSIDAAYDGSKEVEPDEAWSFTAPSQLVEFDWRHDDKELATLPVSKKTDSAIALEAATMKRDSRIKRVRKASYEESIKKVRLINSQGVDVSYTNSMVSCDVLAVAEEGGDSQWAWDFDFSHTFDGLNMEEVGARAADFALSLLGAKGISTMKTPVCLHSFVVSQFLQVLSKSFYGDNIYKNKSTLVGKLGKPLYSKALNVINDGLLEGGFSSSPFDGEGRPSQKTLLIKEGVVENWLTDSYWAKKMGVSSTNASWRKSVIDPPAIGVNNVYIEPSHMSRDALLNQMNRGFYVTSVIGAHTINAITGDFSVGAEGQWIEGGVASFPVKGVVIAGNINDLFKNVVGVAGDLRFMGNVGAPSIMISEVQVGGE